jgi:equilibrative nucleoside transporter 1/2/3
VFPPITISVQPLNPDTHPLVFSAVHFLLFNIGDLAGRLLCSFPRLLVWSRSRLVLFSLARTLFIPLFLACNVQRPSSVPGAPSSAPWIASDLLFFMLMLAFGASNGYVGTMGMIAAPSLEHNERLKGRREDVDTAATVATFCLTMGLAIGSVASFAVRAAVCKCNPFSG